MTCQQLTLTPDWFYDVNFKWFYNFWLKCWGSVTKIICWGTVNMEAEFISTTQKVLEHKFFWCLLHVCRVLSILSRIVKNWKIKLVKTLIFQKTCSYKMWTSKFNVSNFSDVPKSPTKNLSLRDFKMLQNHRIWTSAAEYFISKNKTLRKFSWIFFLNIEFDIQDLGSSNIDGSTVDGPLFTVWILMVNS